MSKTRAFRPGIFLLALAILSLPTMQAALAAQTSPADPATHDARAVGDVDAGRHDIVQGSHVEGHIAFLRAELGITPAQQQLWEPVAAAMRDDVRTIRQADMKAGEQRPRNAIDYLQNRAMFADLRAQGEARFLEALRPLYAILSTQQQQIADELLMPHEQE